MSDSSSSFWKSMALFVLLALIGVYLLYEWYDDKLYAQMADQETRIAQLTKQLKETDAQRRQSQEAHQATRSVLADVKAQHEQERQTRLDRERDLDQMRAEAAKAAAAYDELSAQYEAAKAKIAALQGDLDQVHEVIAKSAAEHRARIEELERHLNERVSLAKTTPMDADLVRAAQLVGVLPQAEADPSDPAEAPAQSDQLAVAQSQLTQLQSDYESTRAQLAAIEAQLQETQAALEESRVAASKALDEANAAHASQVADLERQLAARQLPPDNEHNPGEVATLREQIHRDEQVIADLKAQVTATEDSLKAAQESQRTEAEARINALTGQLENEQSAFAELRQQHDAMVAECNDTLAQTRQQLAAVESELREARESAGQSGQTAAEQIDAAQGRIRDLEAALEEERGKTAQAETRIRAESEQTLAGLRTLYASFAALGGSYTQSGLLLRLAEDQLHFPPGKANLPANDLSSLDRIADLLKRYPQLTARIEGHTDSLGGLDLNLALSQQRAEAVKQALTERGVDGARLASAGIGSARPIADNTTTGGRAQNRRVEIYLIEPAL